MAMLTITITPDYGDEYEIEVGTRDVYVWEKTNHGKTFEGLMRDMAMVDVYQLAHIAGRRQGLIAVGLKEFVETSEITIDGGQKDTEEDDDDKTGPFPQARSPETSSPSPSSPASRRRSGPKKATGR